MDTEAWGKIPRQRLLWCCNVVSLWLLVAIGITCMDRLDNILSVVSNPVQMRESKWIIQKYIGKTSTACVLLEYFITLAMCTL